MTAGERLPRVLVVTSNNFNLQGGGGITLTNLFGGWPADKLANLHEDSTPDDRSVCRNTFRLTGREIHWSWPLSVVEGRITGRDASEATTAIGQRSAAAPGLKRRIISDGLPRSVTITPELARWVDAFRPQLVYGFLGSIAQLRLTKAIADRWRIPVAIHIMDDWADGLYRDGLLAPWLRRTMLREFREVLDRTTLRLAICDPMAREYERRYGGAFHAFHNALHMDEWRREARQEWGVRPPATIRYIGSVLAEAQRDSIRDIGDAVVALRRKGRDVRLSIMSPENQTRELRAAGFPPEAVTIEPAPVPDTVPRLMAQADINLLPFNFDERSARYLRFSMPTKIPAYLISGPPVLVYGPRELAAVQYAIDYRWAHVVTERGVDRASAAIEQLLDDEPYRRELGERAQRRAEDAHEIGRVRARFWSALTSAAGAR